MSEVTSIKADPEAAITSLVNRFAQFYLGRTPRVQVRIVTDMVVVRLMDALTDAEGRLVQADPTPAGRDAVETLFRRSVRQAQPGLLSAIESVLSVPARSVHADLDATAGEGVIVVTLSKESES
jgi:uncharacterized protein YbcI